MNKIQLIIAGIIAAILSLFAVTRIPVSPGSFQNTVPTSSPQPTGFHISSPAFDNNGRIPGVYTCDGMNISPPITISGIPEFTKSMVLIVDDIDAPRGTWVHWLLTNIQPDMQKIQANSVPPGAVQGKNGFGNIAYGGPCPTTGIHRYEFKLFALDIMLVLPQGKLKEDAVNAMNGHVIGSTSIIGTYSRK